MEMVQRSSALRAVGSRAKSMTTVLVQAHALEVLVSTVMIMPTPLLQDATSVAKHRAITMEGVALEILEDLGGLRR